MLVVDVHIVLALTCSASPHVSVLTAEPHITELPNFLLNIILSNFSHSSSSTESLHGVTGRAGACPGRDWVKAGTPQGRD